MLELGRGRRLTGLQLCSKQPRGRPSGLLPHRLGLARPGGARRARPRRRGSNEGRRGAPVLNSDWWRMSAASLCMTRRTFAIGVRAPRLWITRRTSAVRHPSPQPTTSRNRTTLAAPSLLPPRLGVARPRFEGRATPRRGGSNPEGRPPICLPPSGGRACSAVPPNPRLEFHRTSEQRPGTEQLARTDGAVMTVSFRRAERALDGLRHSDS